MKYDIHEHIIYYVEPIEICLENLLLLLLLTDEREQEEEESAPFGVELAAVVVIVPAVLREVDAAVVQLCPQGRERQSTRCRLTRSIYTLRLTKMPSNNIIALQRDEGVSVKVKNRLLTRSRGLL
jgi:hypothetical protein